LTVLLQPGSLFVGEIMERGHSSKQFVPRGSVLGREALVAAFGGFHFPLDDFQRALV
jgi:hypothetical protein